MTEITVVDSIMGSGKTSWAIDYMNKANEDKKFIYITPFLTEVQRIKEGVTNRRFEEPQNQGNGKFGNLKKLILNECDIVSTHALFQKADEEVIELLKASNYTLILDEVMNVIEHLPLKKDDFNLLLDNEMVLVDRKTGVVTWNNSSEYQETKYDELKNLSKTDNLFYFQQSVLFWTFPIQVFQAFKETYVLTYLFQAQEQKYYYDLYNLEYDYKAVQKDAVGRYYLVSYEEKQPYDKRHLKQLINIYEGKLNEIGEYNSLSKSWYDSSKNELLIKKMQDNLYTFFRRHANTKAKFNMWTCFKDNKVQLKKDGYAKGFVSHNARATNDYQEKASLAYTINRYMQPYKKNFFISRGVSVNEDLYALSELLQWIWRSRIRKGEAINLYIPSKRMRKLLKDYFH